MPSRKILIGGAATGLGNASFVKRSRVILSFVLLVGTGLITSARETQAGVFHVDNGNPACSSTDAARGSSAIPYCSIKQAVDEKGGPDVTLMVHSGVYRENVIISHDGLSAMPFVLQATGPGVIVDGSDIITGWTNLSGNVWQKLNVTWTPRRVFSDGTPLALSTAAPAAIPANSFKYDLATTTLYINIGADPNAHTILVSHRDNGFRMFNRSFVTIDGFEVTHANVSGISVNDGSSNVITHNRVSFCGDHGISLLNGSTNTSVIGNESFENRRLFTRAANGIILQGCTSNRIENNRVHDNEDTGIQINLASNNNLSIQNRSWKNGDHGFDHLSGSTGNIHIGDVAWGNFMDGFSVEGNSTGTQLYDCIAVDNGVTSTPTQGANLRVDGTSASGFTSDYNIFWNSSAPNRIEYLGGTSPPIFFSSLAAYQQFTSQQGTPEDVHSLEADPKFVNPMAGDFHLRSGSPAIDSGTSLPSPWPLTDAEGHGREDDPATPNTGQAGSGRPDYADRGALEFVPPPLPPIGDNLCSNPSFELSTIGWEAYYSTIQRLQGSAKDGQFFLRVTGAPSASLFGVNDDPNCIASSPAPGTRYHYSAWVRAASVHGPLQLQVREYLNGVKVGSSTYSSPVTAGNDWTELTVDKVTTVGGSSLDLHVLDNTLGQTFDLDNISVRIVPTPGNNPPTARLTILPSASGVDPFVVTADASASDDDDGIVSYVFDFGDGTVLPAQPGPTAGHTYIAGDWTAKVTVSDHHGATSTASVPVHVAHGTSGGANLCGNPSFETSIKGYEPSSASTLSQGTGGHDGTHSLQIQGPPSINQFYVNDVPNWVSMTPLTSGARYRFTAWVRSPSSVGTRARIRIREYLNGVSQALRVYSIPMFLDASWKQLAVDYVTATGKSSLDFNIVLDPVVVSDVVQVDDITIVLVSPIPQEVGERQASRLEGPPARFAASVTPNPIGAGGTFEFTTTRPGAVKLQFFDASGRRVLGLMDGELVPAGRHRISLGEQRRRLPAGLYFYELRAEEGLLQGRFAVMR